MSLPAQKSLTNLPVEILAIIVRMARNQDLHLKDRLARSRERVATATRDVMRLSKWYGRSLLALHATCKILEGLAKPFVFEAVKFNKSSEDLFLDHVLPNYAHLIKEVVFDCYTKPKYAEAFLGFLGAMKDLTSLKSLVFETYTSITEFTKIYRRSREPASVSNATERYCRPLFASLSRRVTRLTCLESTCSQMKLISEILPKLKYLKRRLLDVMERVDSGAERLAYLSLRSLEELDIAAVIGEDDQSLKNLSTEPQRCEWDRSWSHHSWHSVSSLSFTTFSLTLEDWHLLKTFRHWLKCFKITSLSLQATLSDLEEDGGEWPHLTTLSIIGDEPAIKTLLLRLKLAPIERITLKIVNYTAEFASFLIIEHSQDRWSSLLSSYATSLRMLRVDALTLPYASGALKTVDEHCCSQGVGFETSFGKEETACFIEEGEPLAGIDDEDHPSRLYRPYAHQEVVGDVEDLLHYASKCFDESVRLEDRKEMHRLASLLRGVAAKKLMEGD